MKRNAQFQISTYILKVSIIAIFLVLVWQDGTIAFANDTAEANTVLVHFTPETTEAERNSFIAQMGGELIGWLPQIHVAQVIISADNNQNGRSANSMNALIEQDISIAGSNSNPAPRYSDPDLFDTDKVYAPQNIKAIEGWEITTGSSDIIVAVVDTGLNQDHPEFTGRIVAGYDFVNNDNDPSDDHGHGTHVAGIVSAALNNGMGIAGVCPNCMIMPVKSLNESNIGSWFSIASGIIYATDNGARIVNLSLGTTNFSSTIEKAIQYAQENGVLIVSAAGNIATSENFYPAAFPGVLAVSATSKTDEQWSLSNYGDYIDVAAPGQFIYSTYADLNNFYGGYASMSGTSMAAPHVAGLAGLLLSQKPELTAEELTSIITESADDLGDGGWDQIYGHGRINVVAALKALSPADTTVVATDASEVTLNHHIFLPAINQG